MRSNSREYDVSLRDCLTKDQRTNARTPVVFRGRPIGATEDECMGGKHPEVCSLRRACPVKLSGAVL